ncbi:MAG: orotidine-5'-phosphate decarboxylase [Candidatus Methanofastidiosum sp.]|nr:orotidine-5'-phosphate decarboxylase [Methanofastidiosum sp.]
MKIDNEEVRKKICLALDLDSIEKVREIISQTSEYVGTYKIGKELFISQGIDAIKEVQKYNKDVFLDLKLHDIPNTVEGASRVIVKHGIKFFTIHSLGGHEMIRASRRGVENGVKLYENKAPIILGVTVLTSFNDSNLKDILITKNINDATLHLAKISLDNGCAGIVCSAKDLPFLRPNLESDTFYATPGINVGPRYNLDQKRIASPYEAISNGSSLIIIGRSIIGSDKREEALKILFNEVKEGLKSN